MAVNQIYSIVNSVNQQATGQSDMTVVDEAGLIALGNTILSSATLTENFLNTLIQRIGRVIVSDRLYQNKFKGLMMDNFSYGNVLQKLTVQMPEAESDDQYSLTDGASVDMYKVAKPKALQKLFSTETPYQFHITIQQTVIKTAFTSETEMGRFINSVFSKVQNRIELSNETMGRNALNNFIAEMNGNANREINLLHEYNTATNKSLTIAGAVLDPDFLRWSIGRIKDVSDFMESMSKGMYNDGSVDRFTPKALQQLYVHTPFETKLETVVQYAAFHDDYVKLMGFEKVPFWQSIKTPAEVNVKRASDGTAVVDSYVAAVLFDKEACGTYKHEIFTLTSPVNAAGAYYNTYWHCKDMWFNDLSENGVAFVLKEVL